MGKVLSGLTSIIGMGGAPKAAAKPLDATKSVADVEGDVKATAKKARASLYETAGGIVGEELDPASVKKRQGLLGN